MKMDPDALHQYNKEQDVIADFENKELEAAQTKWEKAHSPHELNDLTTYPGWEPSHDRALTEGFPKLFDNGYRWEVDERGDHRIVDEQGRGGDWTGYQYPAKSPDGRHMVCTQFFLGTYPVEALIELSIAAKPVAKGGDNG